MATVIDPKSEECIDISNYLKADDLKDRDMVVTIASGVSEELSLPGKPKKATSVLYFEGVKPLIANSTNLRTIRDAFGKKPSVWVGKKITLYPTTTKLGRKTVPCIRIREIDPDAQPSAGAGKPVSDQEALKIQVSEALDAAGIVFSAGAVAALRDHMKTTALGNLKPDERKQMFADIAAGKFDHLKENL